MPAQSVIYTFVGEVPQETLDNVRSGLDLIRKLLCCDIDDAELSSEARYGLGLFIENI